jgi:hypothetical protein
MVVAVVIAVVTLFCVAADFAGHPVPIPRAYLYWSLGVAWLGWLWLASGSSAAAVASWVLPYLIVLIVSQAFVPSPWRGFPTAAFFALWALATVWDPARRVWQRANAWATWPLFVAALPASERDRYRIYRKALRLPPVVSSRIVSSRDDPLRQAAALRETAENVRLLEAPSEPWSDVRVAAATAYELWAEMLEAKKQWDARAVLNAFKKRDDAWERVLHRLSPWGWRALMWGPMRPKP